MPARQEEQQRRESLEQVRADGKRLIAICCERCRATLLQVLEIGATETEFFALVDFFRGHSYTSFGAPRHKGRPDIPAIVSEVFALADALPDALRAYFLEAVFADVQERNRAPHRAAELLKFNAAFTRRRSNVGRGKAAQERTEGPTPAHFGPEFMKIVSEALHKMELLNDAGQYIGPLKEKAELAALYRALYRRNYLRRGLSWADAFGKWLGDTFGASVSGKTLEKLPTPEGEAIEKDFLYYID